MINGIYAATLSLLNDDLGLDINKNDIISANYAGVLLLKKLNIKSCRLVLSEKAQEDYKVFKIDKS